MASYAKLICLGTVTRDPELRYLPNGTAVLQLSLAVNRKWKSESGEMKDEASFLDFTAFAKSAETLGQYVKKGHPLMVDARPKQESWTDKQTNQKRSKIVFVIESFQFLGGRDDAKPASKIDKSDLPPGTKAAATDDTEPPF